MGLGMPMVVAVVVAPMLPVVPMVLLARVMAAVVVVVPVLSRLLGVPIPALATLADVAAISSARAVAV